jgi:Lar family restriction alleviation protein
LSDLLEAKPCPFCGEKSIAIHEGSTFRWMVAECNGCGATCGEVRMQTMGPGLPAHWKTKAEQDAVEEWNKRASNARHEPHTGNEATNDREPRT